MGDPVYSSPKPEISAGADPIRTATDNDVLSGRGGAVNSHPGNVRLRSIVGSMKAGYLCPKTRKLQKMQIAAAIVRTIRELDPPGRFLKEDPGTGLWYEIGDKAATRKTGQALRENSSEFRMCWRNILVKSIGAQHEPLSPSGTSSPADSVLP